MSSKLALSIAAALVLAAAGSALADAQQGGRETACVTSASAAEARHASEQGGQDVTPAQSAVAEPREQAGARFHPVVVDLQQPGGEFPSGG